MCARRPFFQEGRRSPEGLHTFPGKGPRKAASHCPDPLQQAGVDVQVKMFDARKDALGWLMPPLDCDRDQPELELSR